MAVDKSQLRALRRELGTMQRVAQALGLTKRSISRYENPGHRVPKWYGWALIGMKSREK